MEKYRFKKNLVGTMDMVKKEKKENSFQKEIRIKREKQGKNNKKIKEK